MEIVLAIVLGAVLLFLVRMAVTFRSRVQKYSAELIGLTRQQLLDTISQHVRSLEQADETFSEQASHRLSAVETKVDDLRSQLRQQTRNVDQLQQRLTSMNAGLLTLQVRDDERNSVYTGEFQRLSGESRQLNDLIVQVRDTEATLRAELKTAQRAINAFKDVDANVARLRSTTQELGARTDRRLSRLERAVDRNGARTDQLDDFRREMSGWRSEADMAYERVGLRVGLLRNMFRQRLDHEAALRSSGRWEVLSGGFCAARPLAADVLPLLVGAFLKSLSLSVLYEEQQENWHTLYVLRPGSVEDSAENQFTQLLALCSDGNDGELSVPGLTEFRSMILGIHNGGPAVLTLGPFIMIRTKNDLVAGARSTSTATFTPEILGAPEVCAKRLAQSAESNCQSLLSWAQRY